MLGKPLVALASFALWLSTAACGPTRYAYAPVTTTSAEVVGHPAADYAFPPDSPQGRVRLATFGIAQIVRDGPWYFHVRLSARNDGQETWLIDKQVQILQVVEDDDHEHTTVVRAAVDVGDSPVQVEVPPQATRDVDLFFPLPPGARDPTDVPGFEVSWTVRAGARYIPMTTAFERFLASGPARNVPRAAPNYPLADGVNPGNRLPGTPDDYRWPQPTPSPDTVPLPGPPSP